MRKLLQILTIVLLVLSISALVLGYLLFGKRELLKGRTQVLEKGLVQITALLETPMDPEAKPATFTEKDVAEVTAQVVPEPERASFWKDYPLHLEDADKPLMVIKREDLMNLYKVDPISGKPVKNVATGLKETEGENTLDAALKRISAAAQYELDQLNQTRHQLRAVREELVKTIEEVNDGKQKQRQSLVTINDPKNQIAGLEDEKRGLEGQVATLTDEKRALEDDVAAKDTKIQEQDTEITDLKETIDTQRKELAKYKDPSRAGGPQLAGPGNSLIQMAAGRKGRVVSVNQDWTYVVLQLDQEALDEIQAMRTALANQNMPGFPTVELFLKRGDNYVSKVKLVQIKPEEKLAIADVLVDWQQVPVQAGDVAFF